MLITLTNKYQLPKLPITPPPPIKKELLSMNAVPYITCNKFLKALRDSASLASHGRLFQVVAPL